MANGPLSFGAGLYVMEVAVLACVATTVAGLVGRRPAVARVDLRDITPMRRRMPVPGVQYANAEAFLAAPTNEKAILAFVCAFVVPPLAIVFGYLGRNEIRRTGEQGSGLALAGLILGYISPPTSCFSCCSP